MYTGRVFDTLTVRQEGECEHASEIPAASGLLVRENVCAEAGAEAGAEAEGVCILAEAFTLDVVMRGIQP